MIRFALGGMSGDLLAMLELAQRRYPRTEPTVALMMFDSDRRAAGLGALGYRTRPGGLALKRHPRTMLSVSNTKERYMLTDRLLYTMRVSALERDELPEFIEMPVLGAAADATTTIIRRKGFDVAMHLPWDRRALLTERDRTMLAHALREARRKFRQEVADAKARS